MSSTRTWNGVFLLALAACGTRAATVQTGLAGTAWVLEDLAGAGVVERDRATLEFDDAGRASGNGSCNRFSGPVTLSGDRISFGPLMSTKMACVEDALTAQEMKYLEALGAAERYAVEDSTLLIYRAGDGVPLRFSRAPLP
jgi:heat shock protein HslJ